MDENLRKAKELFTDVTFELILARKAYNCGDLDKFNKHAEEARKLKKRFERFMIKKQVDTRLVR